MKKRHVIAFVGMPGAGKGTCTAHLEAEYGWPVLHFGNMVYEEVQRRGLDNVKDEVFVREDMREQEGMDVLAKHIGRKTEAYLKDGHEVVVLDGLYSWGEYKHLESVFGDDLTMIAVVAPKKLRRQRVLDRKDSHRTYTLEQLVNREIAEIENIEKGGPIAYADYYLLNTAGPYELLAHLNNILKELDIIE